jgi:hypothetical protein
MRPVCLSLFMCVCVCVRACARACVRASGIVIALPRLILPGYTHRLRSQVPASRPPTPTPTHTHELVLADAVRAFSRTCLPALRLPFSLQ